MDSVLQDLAGPTSLSAWRIALNLTVAFLLGLFVSWVYRASHRSTATSHSFVNTLVLVCMIMAVVIMVIGNNIARAFGLAGAMSIIRFRTVVKDTRDTAFVFFALAAGMGAGTGNLLLAVIGTLQLGLFVGFLHRFRHGMASSEAFVLTFEREPTTTPDGDGGLESLIDAPLRSQELLGLRSVRMGQFLEYRYLITPRKPSDIDRIARELSETEGVERVDLSRGDIGVD